MAAIACNGCNLFIDGINSTGRYDSSLTIEKSYILLGNGNGVFSGASGVPLATVYLVSRNTTDGLCQGYTGNIYFTGAITGSWTGNAFTGCTGRSGCQSELLFAVRPNPSLFTQFPSSVGFVYSSNFCNGSVQAASITGGSTPPPPLHPQTTGCYYFYQGTMTQPCGSVCHYNIDITWLAPQGQSGTIHGQSGHVVNCTYCSPYEIVSL